MKLIKVKIKKVDGDKWEVLHKGEVKFTLENYPSGFLVSGYGLMDGHYQVLDLAEFLERLGVCI